MLLGSINCQFYKRKFEEKNIKDNISCLVQFFLLYMQMMLLSLQNHDFLSNLCVKILFFMSKGIIMKMLLTTRLGPIKRSTICLI